MKTHTHFDNNFVVTFGHNKIKQAKVFQTYLYITINNPFHHLPPQNIEKIKHSPVTNYIEKCICHVFIYRYKIIGDSLEI